MSFFNYRIFRTAGPRGIWAQPVRQIGPLALDFDGFYVYNISMQKIFFIFFSFIFIAAVPSVFAQKSRAVGQVLKAPALGTRAVSSAVSRTVSPAVPAAAFRALSGTVHRAASVPSIKPAPAAEALRVADLERTLQSLRVENQMLKTTIQQISAQTPSLLRATFQAVETTDVPTNPFSGTVFKTVYNGQEEIFGVVAAHAIAKSTSERALKRHFSANLFDGEKFVEVPAEIVQLSSPSMLDIALIKFSPEAETLFQPLRISEVPVKFGDVLSSQGFAGNADVNIPARTITAVTPLSVRTTIPYARDDRPGLCGSAVVNDKHELVGIHTGSTYDRMDAAFDVGYATNASFLNTLVKAYHNGGEASFPLVLNKQKIVDLNVDEYISYVSFLDANGKTLWQQGFQSKFSYSKVQEMLEIYSPRYMTLTVRRASWNPDSPEVLFESHTASWDSSKTTYKYDFETGKIVSKSKPKAKR